MNILFVYAHPNANSFGGALRDSMVEKAKAMGHEVRVRDLYAMQFNPVLGVPDFEAISEGTYPADIAEEHTHIKWCDLMVHVYPVWFQGPPAILKGYMDRVFTKNFAYADKDDGSSVPLLTDKKAMTVCTLGAPYEIYQKIGMETAINTCIDAGTFGFCGIKAIEHYYFGNVHQCSNDERKNMIAKAAELIEKHCK